MSSIEVKHWSNGNIKSLRIYDDEDLLHNTEGPAAQGWYINGRRYKRKFCINGYHHNTEGPAAQYWYNDGQESRREFYINGYFNNTEGPAVIEWDKNGVEEYRRYFINAVEYTEEEFYRLKDTVEVSVEGGKTVRISRQSAESLNLI